MPAFTDGCFVSDCVTRDETVESSLNSLYDVFPSAIASGASVQFIEDEELDLLEAVHQPALVGGDVNRSTLPNSMNQDTQSKSNLNMIVLVAVLLVAIVVKLLF